MKIDKKGKIEKAKLIINIANLAIKIFEVASKIFS